MRFLLILSLFLNSCGKDSNPSDPGPEPVLDCTSTFTSQEYTWRMDTLGLNFGRTLFPVAFSDSEIFVIGATQLLNGNLASGFYWNGKKWSSNIFGTGDDIGNTMVDVCNSAYLMVTVGARYFATEIPAVGEFNNITKKWTNYQFSDSGSFLSVWCDRNSNFIAGGNNGVLYQKLGLNGSWTKIKSPSSFNISSIGGISKDNYFIYSYKWNFEIADFEYEIWENNYGKWIRRYQSSNPGLSTGMPGFSPKKIGGFTYFYCTLDHSSKLFFTTDPSYYYYRTESDSVFKKGTLPFFGSIDSKEQFPLVLSPNDIWFPGYRWYHWNGKTFAEIILPGNFSLHASARVARTKSNTMIIPATDFNYWVVVQGKPK